MNSETTMSTPNVQNELGDFLQKAYTTARHLPLAQRHKVLRACLSYRLNRFKSANDRRTTLETLCSRFNVARTLPTATPDETSGAGANPTPLSTSHMNSELESRFEGLIEKVLGAKQQDLSLEDKIVNLELTLGTAIDLLQDATGKRRFQNYSLLDLVQIAHSRMKDTDEAINQAANESFNRILASVDPESVSQSVEKSSVKIGPFFKAAKLDAISEKYKQLQLYHERGRLVRDFRAMYKNYLSKIRKD